MSEILDRVAMAIRAVVLPEGADAATDWEVIGEGARRMYRRDATAAIRAMREPTEAMINSPMARCYNDGPYADKEVRRIFSAMIDVALAVPSDQ